MTTTSHVNRFGRPYTGWVPGHEDLVDPTAVEVITAAQLLATAVTTQAAQAEHPHCTNGAMFGFALGSAVGTLLRIADRLETSRGEALSQVDVELAREAFTWVKTAHDRYTVNGLNMRMGACELEAAALCRLVNAAVTGTCLAGQSRPYACWPSPERLRLRVTDELGHHDDQDHGCVMHVTEQYLMWDPALVQRTLIGPPQAADKVRKLGGALQRVWRDGQLPREFDDQQRRAAAAAARIEYPHPGSTT